MTKLASFPGLPTVQFSITLQTASNQILDGVNTMTKPQQAKRLAVTMKTVTHQATVVCSVHLLELFNGGSDGGCEEETSLGDVTEMAVLQEGSVPERDGKEGEREGGGVRGREREGELVKTLAQKSGLEVQRY